jgi:hypothetical protein
MSGPQLNRRGTVGKRGGEAGGGGWGKQSVGEKEQKA